ncbi:MAG: gamma-glutamyltransferase [Pseudomonadota bacterium]
MAVKKTVKCALAATAAALFVGAAAAQAPSAARADATGAYALMSFDSRFHPEIGAGGMVSAQDAIAAEVGRDILKRGGNAIDAAVATGFALAVTHPQAGNLGGGGFLLAYLAEQDEIIAIDFREKAPAAATRDMFVGADGEVDNELARFSHLSSGVPGSVMGLTHALEKYGSLPLKDVIAPAIKLAEKGFEVSYGLNASTRRAAQRFERDPSSLAYFLNEEGAPFDVGGTFVQRDLAKTLKAIARNGAAGFYEGAVADLIVAEMSANGGLITHDDLKNYHVVERAAVRGTYRGYDIISMPPPSSGGVHVVQMLNILEGYDLASLGHNSADYIHRLVEAMRRAYADRSEYLGDPDFYEVPIAELTDKAYAGRLRDGISLKRASKSADINPGLAPPPESPETTHFSVMDKAGNAVAVTTTLNFSYGSGFSVDGAGFLLNNEMDDFSAKKGTPNAFGLLGGDANAIEPGKRPLSSMTPTIVLKDGRPHIVTGSPGGSTIITVVLQVILNIIEFDMNPLQATAAPRIHHQWKPDIVVFEPGHSPDTLRALDARGFNLLRSEDGSVNARVMGRANTIVYKDGFFYGAADPRGPKSGVAAY